MYYNPRVPTTVFIIVVSITTVSQIVSATTVYKTVVHAELV